MYKALILTQLRAVWSGMFRGSRAKKRSGTGMKILLILLAVYVVGILAVNFGMMFSGLCQPLFQAGAGWTYFAVMAILAVLLGFFITVFQAQSLLFEARDNDLLLAMPIPPGAILLSRIVGIMSSLFLYQAVVSLPCIVVYFLYFPFRMATLVLFLAAMLLLSLLTMCLSCLFAWLCALLNAKFHIKNLISVVMSLGFLAGYFFLYFKMQDLLTVMTEGASLLAERLRPIAPLYWLGSAIADRDLLSLLALAAVSGLPFVAAIWLLSRGFLALSSGGSSSARKARPYHTGAVAVSSPRRALIRKELAHFKADPMYVMNAVTGSLMTVILAVAAAVKHQDLTALFSSFPAGISASAVLCTGVSLLAAMNLSSAASVSIEAKQLWLMHSIPVPSGEILMAKVWMSVITEAPVILIAGTLLNCFFSVTPFQWLLMYLLPLSFTLLTSAMGVWINLHFPKLDWISEVIAVKQGASSMICMLVGMAAVIVPVILYAVLAAGRLSVETAMLIVAAVYLLLFRLLCRGLRGRGAALFDAL